MEDNNLFVVMTKEEFNSIRDHLMEKTRGIQNRMLYSLEIGEALKIDSETWLKTHKRKPTFSGAKKGDRNYRCKTSSDGTFWVIVRTA